MFCRCGEISDRTIHTRMKDLTISKSGNNFERGEGINVDQESEASTGEAEMDAKAARFLKELWKIEAVQRATKNLEPGYCWLFYLVCIFKTLFPLKK